MIKSFSGRVNTGNSTGKEPARAPIKGDSGLGFSSSIMTGYEESRNFAATKPAGRVTKSKALKVVKYLAKKDGLKVSAKMLGKWAVRLGKVLGPTVTPLFWLSNIYDIAETRAAKHAWRDIRDPEWRALEVKKSRRRVLLGRD